MNNVSRFFRNLKNQPGLSLLIILTLSMGFTTAFFIYQYVNYELSYDEFENDGIYRVNVETIKDGTRISRTARSSPALGTMLVENVPGISNYSRVVLMGEVILQKDERVTREKDVLLADKAHFNMFTYEWMDGDASAMDKPFYLSISEELAVRIFGNTSVAGRELELNSPNFEGTFPFTISGVYENRPADSHLRPEVLISYKTLHRFIGEEIDQSWNWNNLFTYIQTDEDPDVLVDNVNRTYQQVRSEEMENSGIRSSLIVQDIREIHTTKGYVGEFMTGIDVRQVGFVGLLALFIILMTYTNFLNLFLVRTVDKRREMAVRSVLGSSNIELFRLSFIDIVLLHSISAILCITLIQWLSPYITNEFALEPAVTGALSVQLRVILVLCLVGIVCSSFFILLRFHGVKWAGNLSGGRTTASRADIRSYTYLLGIQLMIAVFFMAGSIVVYHQVKAISEYDLGIDLSDKIIVRSPLYGTYPNISDYKSIFWSEISDVEGITDVVLMNEVPGSEIYWRMDNVGKNPDQPEPVTFAWLAISDGYMKFFDVNFLAGRDFDPKNDTYNSSIILNETGARLMGFDSPEDAVDKTVYLGDHPISIIGVIPDFIQENLRVGVEPQFFRYGKEGLNYFAIQTSGKKVDMDLIKEAYNNVFPGAPFDYFNLQQHYEKQYVTERLLIRIILAMSLMALFISVTGIIGMSLQILERRSKELMIKKIHGASGLDLWKDVSAVFYRISMVSVMLGLPVAYFVFNQWINQYVTASFPVVMFIVIPVIILGVALILSITFQILRTVRRNPREVLASE